MSAPGPVPHLRVARPTDRLDELTRQYCDGLGLELLGSFREHEGFDGAMVGDPRAGYHLEFTTERGADAGGSPSPEHLLVLYFASEAEFDARAAAMVTAGFRPVESHNPYWDRHGATFEDLDGYRVVLNRGDWR